MAWIILIIAGLLETIWALSLKASQGFTNPLWSAVTMITAGSSFWLLGYALRILPVGTAYAVWTGIGAIGATLAGIIFLKEPVSFLRIASIAIIIGGVIGLYISSAYTSLYGDK